MAKKAYLAFLLFAKPGFLSCMMLKQTGIQSVLANPMSVQVSFLCGLTQHQCKLECMLVLVQVVVQGIPFAYAWQDLKDLFKPVGGVKADIVMGQDGRSKGWGTVLFDSQEDTEKAIQVYWQVSAVAKVRLLWSACLNALSCSVPAQLSAGKSVAARLHELPRVQR